MKGGITKFYWGLVVYRMVSRKRVRGKVWEGVGDEYMVTNK